METTYEVASALVMVVAADRVLLLEARTPPVPGATSGEVLLEALAASATKASRVFPVVGALIAPTIPFWQWLPVVWPQ